MENQITNVSVMPIAIKNNPPCRHMVFLCNCLVNQELWLGGIRVTMTDELSFEYSSLKNDSGLLNYLPLGNLKAAIERKIKQEIQASVLSR